MCGGVDPSRADTRWRSTRRRVWFEGEYPWTSWSGAPSPRPHDQGYAPSEYQTKQWPEEVQIEGWFPPFRRGHVCFHVVEVANAESSNGKWPSSSALADGSDASCGRVDRTPVCPGGLNPDKPRRTCRQGADASVEEERGRSGEICLDTSFHRRSSSGPRGPSIRSSASRGPSSRPRGTDTRRVCAARRGASRTCRSPARSRCSRPTARARPCPRG